MPYKDPKVYKEWWQKRNKKAYKAGSMKKLKDREVQDPLWYAEYAKEKQRRMRIKVKKEVIKAYGGKCVCCGETNMIFLTIDHINNDGGIHRKLIGTGTRIHKWARNNNYPSTLQILCFNCNIGKSINRGVCPHQREDK